MLRQENFSLKILGADASEWANERATVIEAIDEAKWLQIINFLSKPNISYPS